MEKFKNYIGTKKTLYSIATETERQIVKEWIKDHYDLKPSEYVQLLTSLFQGESINEISIASELLQYVPELRRQVEPKYLDRWLNNLQGWAEIDSLCQSKFTADEVLENWEEWRSLLRTLVSDENVSKKRASLVLLTKPVRDSEDLRLAETAFSNVDKLKKERNILVTKAISWLLRDLIKHHREMVEKYLVRNQDVLPKIAMRETKTKLLTGRKTPPRQKHRH